MAGDPPGVEDEIENPHPNNCNYLWNPGLADFLLRVMLSVKSTIEK